MEYLLTHSFLEAIKYNQRSNWHICRRILENPEEPTRKCEKLHIDMLGLARCLELYICTKRGKKEERNAPSCSEWQWWKGTQKFTCACVLNVLEGFAAHSLMSLLTGVILYRCVWGLCCFCAPDFCSSIPTSTQWWSCFFLSIGKHQEKKKQTCDAPRTESRSVTMFLHTLHYPESMWFSLQIHHPCDFFLFLKLKIRLILILIFCSLFVAVQMHCHGVFLCCAFSQTLHCKIAD